MPLPCIAGKQYLGWKAIRDKFVELTEKYNNRANAPASRPSEHEDPRSSNRDSRSSEARRPDERDSRRYDDRERRYDRGHERERSPR